uniref:Uncharacterized protein n=1 Tax=Anguilla anguilla TaxID=7936 RepID=A0A0E9XDU2_ANGAN
MYELFPPQSTSAVIMTGLLFKSDTFIAFPLQANSTSCSGC